VDAVSKLVRLSHRYEAGSPERAAKLAAMREKVDDLLNEPTNNQGRPDKGNNITFIPTQDNERGTSRDYTVRRLKRDRPDLAEMVIGGAMSANAAAIEAGFRCPPPRARERRRNER